MAGSMPHYQLSLTGQELAPQDRQLGQTAVYGGQQFAAEPQTAYGTVGAASLRRRKLS
jgi:hypothetical protein